MEYVVGHLPAVLDNTQFPDDLEAQTVLERQTAHIPALNHRTQREPWMVNLQVAENNCTKMGAVPAADQLGVHPQPDITNRWILDQACHSGLNAGAAEANRLVTRSNRPVAGRIVDDGLRCRKIVGRPLSAVSPTGHVNGLVDGHRTHLAPRHTSSTLQR